MKKLVINDIDCTEMATRYGLELKYKKIFGKAKGTMLDGSTTEDVIATKAALTFNFIPQSEEALASFVKSVYSEPYAKVNYFDLRENAYREIEAIYSEIGAKYIYTNIEGFSMWKVNTMTFTER